MLNLHLRALGWKNASLWAMTPHYLTVGPNPNAAVSLVDRIDHAFGTTTSRAGLQEQSAIFEEQVREVLEESGDAGAYVQQLEEQYDSERPGQGIEQGAPDELPAPGDLLDDLERFLRDQKRGTNE